jgi:hypothetical protein
LANGAEPGSVPAAVQSPRLHKRAGSVAKPCRPFVYVRSLGAKWEKKGTVASNVVRDRCYTPRIGTDSIIGPDRRLSVMPGAYRRTAIHTSIPIRFLDQPVLDLLGPTQHAAILPEASQMEAVCIDPGNFPALRTQDCIVRKPYSNRLARKDNVLVVCRISLEDLLASDQAKGVNTDQERRMRLLDGTPHRPSA